MEISIRMETYTQLDNVRDFVIYFRLTSEFQPYQEQKFPNPQDLEPVL
jgi:hypothetical protein